jgi:hypothetical protein
MCPQHTNIYYPLTRTVKQLNNKKIIQHRAISLQKECEQMQRVLGKIINFKNEENRKDLTFK